MLIPTIVLIVHKNQLWTVKIPFCHFSLKYSFFCQDKKCLRSYRVILYLHTTRKNPGSAIGNKFKENFSYPQLYLLLPLKFLLVTEK